MQGIIETRDKWESLKLKLTTAQAQLERMDEWISKYNKKLAVRQSKTTNFERL